MNRSFACIVALSLVATVAYPEYEQTKHEPVRWSSTETMAVGAALGAAEGLACSMADDLVWWPVSWLLFSEIKTVIAKAIVNDAHRNGQTLDASLLNNTSRLASWITYLALFQPLHLTRTVYVDGFTTRTIYSWNWD